MKSSVARIRDLGSYRLEVVYADALTAVLDFTNFLAEHDGPLVERLRDNPVTTVQITISDALAKEAAAEGLLDPGAFEAILRERLAAIRVGKMQAARQKMVSAAMPPMAAKEIEAEIKAYRAERRRAAGT